MLHYEYKRYEIAKSDFQELVDQFPDNDKYKNWLVGAKVRKLAKVGYIFWYMFMASLIFPVILNLDNGLINRLFLYTSVITAVIGLSIEGIKYMLNRSVRTLHNNA